MQILLLFLIGYTCHPPLCVAVWSSKLFWLLQPSSPLVDLPHLTFSGRRYAQFHQGLVSGLERDLHLLSDRVVSEPLVGWVPTALCVRYFWVGRAPLVHLAVCTLVLLCLLVFLDHTLHFLLLGLLVIYFTVRC